MNKHEMIKNVCMTMGDKQFKASDIAVITNLERKRVSSVLSILCKSGLLRRVKLGVYELVSEIIDPNKVAPVKPKRNKRARINLGKKETPPNTIEIPPKFMLFHPEKEEFQWTAKDIEDAGFELICASIEGQGTIGKVKEYTDLPHDKYYTEDGVLFEMEWQERRNITIKSQTISGEHWDDITPKIAARRCHDFAIRMKSMWLGCIVKGIQYKIFIQKYKGKFMVSSMNGVSIHNSAFNLDTLFRIIGDMFYKSCTWTDSISGKEGSVCNKEIPKEYRDLADEYDES